MGSRGQGLDQLHLRALDEDFLLFDKGCFFEYRLQPQKKAVARLNRVGIRASGQNRPDYSSARSLQRRLVDDLCFRHDRQPLVSRPVSVPVLEPNLSASTPSRWSMFT